MHEDIGDKHNLIGYSFFGPKSRQIMVCHENQLINYFWRY